MERNPSEVQTLDPTTPISECTVVELLNEALRRAEAARKSVGGENGKIAREYALSCTHTEDAITRFNKGVYMERGTFAISDAERATEPVPA